MSIQDGLFHNQLEMQFQNSQKIGNIQDLLSTHYNNALKRYYRVNYHCSCSKKYESYSALYFHVRQKHGVKLNAAISEPFVQAKIQDQDCHIIYHVEQIRNKQQEQRKQLLMDKERFLRSNQNVHGMLQQPNTNQMVIQNNLDSAISGFIQTIKTKKLENLPEIKAVLQFFKKFIWNEIKLLFPETQNRKSSKVFKLTACQNLPTYFNKFLIQFLPQKTKKAENLQLAMDVLFDFANWMKQHSLTSILVQRNDEFIN